MSPNNFFIKLFHIYKNLEIHQLNIIKIVKKDYKRNLVKDIKVFVKKKKEKKQQMVMNDTKIYQKIKKSLLSIEKNNIK